MLGWVSACSKLGREIVWNYFKENHTVFKDKYGSGSLLSRLVKVIVAEDGNRRQISLITIKKQKSSLINDRLPLPQKKATTENFASEERLQDVSAFFEANPIPSAERTVQQSLESIKANADWLSRDSQIIKNYLTSSSQL